MVKGGRKKVVARKKAVAAAREEQFNTINKELKVSTTDWSTKAYGEFLALRYPLKPPSPSDRRKVAHNFPVSNYRKVFTTDIEGRYYPVTIDYKSKGKDKMKVKQIIRAAIASNFLFNDVDAQPQGGKDKEEEKVSEEEEEEEEEEEDEDEEEEEA